MKSYVNVCICDVLLDLNELGEIGVRCRCLERTSKPKTQCSACARGSHVNTEGVRVRQIKQLVEV